MVVLNPVMMVGTIMLVKQVYSPSFRENPGVVVAGRCRGRRTSSGVVVAGQVLFILKIFQNKSPSLGLNHVTVVTSVSPRLPTCY
jgi:hypothetical protein